MATVMREPDAGRRERLLDFSYGQGFRYFDTAPIYGFGTAEAEIGKLVGRGATGLQIATKFGRDVTRGGSLIRKVQQPARHLVRSLPGLRSAFHKTNGGVRPADAPTIDVFRHNLDSSLRAMRLESVDSYLAHEIAWSGGWTALWEQLSSADLPVRSLGIAGPHELLATYPSVVLETSDVVQIPLADADNGIGGKLIYAAVSTLRDRYRACKASRPRLLEDWGLSPDIDDRSVTPFLVAAALRRIPDARILIGTTSVSHLAAITSDVPAWVDSTSVDWRAVYLDLFDHEWGVIA
jgi:hypothetical protein